MALEKTKTMDSGVVGDYWRITDIKLDMIKGIVAGKISFYISKADRDAGKTPANGMKFAYLKADAIFDEDGEVTTPAVLYDAWDFNDKNIVEEGYDVIKDRNTFFGDATDV